MTTGARRVLVAGASGYIGRHVVEELVRRGHDVTALVRAGSPAHFEGAARRVVDVTDASSVARDGFRGERFDAVVSCLASRTGLPRDARLVDEAANLNLLSAALSARADQFVLLSAICVQRPRLEFQRAKLAFEKALAESGMPFSIVRPTAFFKSLAGQVEAVKRGKPFTVFGNGELTACKPISERDLASFLADCLDDPAKRNAILPIGGPGPAITPNDQAKLLFELVGRPPRIRRVPLALMDLIVGGLAAASSLVPALAPKAELARIGRYYATESMLSLDPAGLYDADATPSYGADLLRDFYARVLVEGLAGQELGAHAVFSKRRRA